MALLRQVFPKPLIVVITNYLLFPLSLHSYCQFYIVLSSNPPCLSSPRLHCESFMEILHVMWQSKLYCRHGTCGYTAYLFMGLHLVDCSEFYLMHNVGNWMVMKFSLSPQTVKIKIMKYSYNTFNQEPQKFSTMKISCLTVWSPSFYKLAIDVKMSLFAIPYLYL